MLVFCLAHGMAGTHLPLSPPLFLYFLLPVTSFIFPGLCCFHQHSLFLLPHPDSSLKLAILCSHPPRDLLFAKSLAFFPMYSFSIYTAWISEILILSLLLWRSLSSRDNCSYISIYQCMIKTVKKVPLELFDRMIRECFVEGALKNG